MAVNFTSERVSFSSKRVRVASKDVNFASENVSQATKDVSFVFMMVNFIFYYGNFVLESVKTITKHINLIIHLDNTALLTDRKNPLSAIGLQAHWAGAKRQQHLPKELVLQFIISAESIIHRPNQNSNEDKPDRMDTDNTGQCRQCGCVAFRSANRNHRAEIS